jgi:hypothetical protein
MGIKWLESEADSGLDFRKWDQGRCPRAFIR